MNKAEIFDKWIGALESGKYIHGTTKLKSVDSNGQIRHCSLGVLANILGITVNENGIIYIGGEPDLDYEIFSQIFDYTWIEQIWKKNDKSGIASYQPVIDFLKENRNAILY